MKQYVSWEITQKSNKWTGQNQCHWSSPETDALYRQAASELDPVKRAALYIRMNDLVVAENVLPIVQRGSVVALANGLHAPRSAWDVDMSNLADWYKEA